MRELDLLEHIYSSNGALPSDVTIGPGDDTACVRLTGTEVLVTVDQVADGVHVDVASTPIEKIARKAVARSLSDVAAMAAVPTAAVVAASLPRSFGSQQSKRLFDAISKVAASYGCPLVGGDISIWDQPLLLSVTVLAQPAGIAPVTRAGAQVGDLVCVTGSLGGSRYDLNGYIHHLDFEPRLAVARRLATCREFSLHSMIDLSDGLAMDLPRLCEARGQTPLAAWLWADRLPVSPAGRAASDQDGRPDWHHALGDGEDYELCFTVSPRDAAWTLPAQIAGVPVTQIGLITTGGNGPKVTLQMPDGVTRSVGGLGWEHTGLQEVTSQ